jgi:hypothetical protein
MAVAIDQKSPVAGVIKRESGSVASFTLFLALLTAPLAPSRSFCPFRCDGATLLGVHPVCCLGGCGVALELVATRLQCGTVERIGSTPDALYGSFSSLKGRHRNFQAR